MSEIEQLKAQLAQKEQDEKELAEFIFKTFRAMGVKEFNDLDAIGTTVMKELPKIIMESTFAQHKLKARFAHFQDSAALLEKFKHHIPQ